MKKSLKNLKSKIALNLSSIQGLNQAAMPTKAIVLLNQTGLEESVPIVKLGDNVNQKQLIAKANSGKSVNIHSPIPGKVSATGFMNIVDKGLCAYLEITMGGFFSTKKNNIEKDINNFNKEEILSILKDCGISIVGKETGQPLHEYLKPSKEGAKFLVINALESKPFSNLSSSLIYEKRNELFKALSLIKRILEPKKILFYINEELINLKEIIEDAKNSQNLDLELIFYNPSGSKDNDYLLAQQITGSKEKSDVMLELTGYYTLNLNTLLSVYNAAFLGEVHIKQAINIAGDAISSPKHLDAYLGTPISFLLDECGGLKKNKTAHYIVGSMMQGYKIADLNTPITKNIEQILVVSRSNYKSESIYACTMCNRCVKSCPRKLWPHMLYKAVSNQRFDIAYSLKLDYCIECGQCSFICPSNLPLSASFKLAHHYKKTHGQIEVEQRKFTEKDEIAAEFIIPMNKQFKPNVELEKSKIIMLAKSKLNTKKTETTKNNSDDTIPINENNEENKEPISELTPTENNAKNALKNFSENLSSTKKNRTPKTTRKNVIKPEITEMDVEKDE